MSRRSTAAREAVLAALRGGEWAYGLDIARAARLRSGRFYPAIHGLEADGVVEAKWDDLEPGRVYRRRLYRLTMECRT